MNLTLIATTIMGFESVLAQELKDLGYTNLRVSDHKVEFEGTLEDICTANIWLRTAGRIYVKIAEFKATTFDDLFEETQALDWATWIGKNDQFPVTKITSRKSALFSKSDCQAIVKKAIAASLENAHNCQSLPETGSVYPIRIQIDKDWVTLSMDTTGHGLNKRGYRAHMDIAPLRETLAAGLVLLSRFKADRDALMDPCCGTGTILIEAGLIGRNIAPGLNRTFLSESWDIIPQKHWEDANTKAKDSIKKDVKFRIYGSDINYKALSVANKNIELAGLSDIFVQKRDISEISSRFDQGKIITNPPYGERLSEQEDVVKLYQNMGKKFRQEFPDWSYYILSGNDEFQSHFGGKATKNRKLYNGGMACWYYQYFAKIKRK